MLHRSVKGPPPPRLDRATAASLRPRPDPRGIFDGGAKASVNAVGYLGEPVKPGTELEATVHIDSLVLVARARARGRWDE